MITLIMKYFIGSWKLLWLLPLKMAYTQVPFSNPVPFPCLRQQLYVFNNKTNTTTQELFLYCHVTQSLC